MKARAADEAELSAEIESILRLPDTTSFVTLQEGAKYLDALCEDEDEVVGKVCDKYGSRIAAYGERLRRIQEQRATKARKQGTSVTTRGQAAAQPPKTTERQVSSEQMELIDDICFSWRRHDEGQTQHLMQRWNARYPDYSPFSCPLTVNGKQVVDKTVGPLSSPCFGLCAGARDEGTFLVAPEWPPAPKTTAEKPQPSPVCAKLKSYVCESGHQSWCQRITPIVEHSAARGITAPIADKYCGDWLEYDAQLRSGKKPYLSTNDPAFCDLFADKEGCLRQQQGR